MGTSDWTVCDVGDEISDAPALLGRELLGGELWAGWRVLETALNGSPFPFALSGRCQTEDTQGARLTQDGHGSAKGGKQVGLVGGLLDTTLPKSTAKDGDKRKQQPDDGAQLGVGSSCAGELNLQRNQFAVFFTQSHDIRHRSRSPRPSR